MVTHHEPPNPPAERAEPQRSPRARRAATRPIDCAPTAESTPVTASERVVTPPADVEAHTIRTRRKRA
jgi:hypothetical protein